MKKYIFIFTALLTGLLSACDDMLDSVQPYLDAGEKIYVGKVDSLEAFSGRNRILLEGLYMYGVTQKRCTVTWENMDGEEQILEMDVVRSESVDKFEVIIDNLEEGQYEFTIVTYDAKGNSSIKSTIEGYAYGDLYAANLTNRRIDGIGVKKGVVDITWRPINGALKTELYYLNKEGQEVMLEVPTSVTTTTLTDCKTTQSIRWRTVYLPEETAIDQFYSEFSEMELPKEEYELDKANFKEVVLDNDVPMNAWGHSMAEMWDNDRNWWNMAHSTDFTEFPVSFTFDLGVKAEISRYTYWQRQDWVYCYKAGNMKDWEVWGRVDKPDQSGSWDGWTLLMSCSHYKPSGLPVDTYTSEDEAYMYAGQEFTLPENTPAVRYIRIKALSTWGGDGHITIAELSFYGREVE